MRLRLGTRGSELARTQSGLVADALRAAGHEVELVVIRSDGDVTAGSLLDAGGLGVFAASLRRDLLAGRVDLAVHSLKDLPTAGVDGLVIAAIPPREDPSDALCARDGLTLDTLPTGARVGTGSPRRAAQLRVRRPDLTVVEIRGNVGTRLARVHGDGTAPGAGRTRGDLDAVVLASAGLARLGRADAITDILDVLPAPGQGALAVECRADDLGVRAALAALDDPVTRACVTAERTVLADLAAGCAAPVACRARVVDGRLELIAAVFDHAGTAQVRVEHLIDLPESSPPGSGASPIEPGGSLRADTSYVPASHARRRRRPVHHAGRTVPGNPPHEIAPAEPYRSHPSDGLDAPSAHSDDRATTADPDVDLTGLGEQLGHVAAADLLARGAGDITPLGAARPSRLAEFHDEVWGVHGAPTGMPGAASSPFHDASELWAPGTVPALVGRRVLLPRADGALADAIRAAGAAVDCIPVTTTRVLPFSLPGPADWLILTSPTAVRVLVDADVELPMLGAQIATVGPATAAAVRETGATVDVVCEGRSDAGMLLDTLAGVEPGSALLPCSALADPRLADGLRALGWDVEVLHIYTTEPVVPTEADCHPAGNETPAPHAGTTTSGVREHHAQLRNTSPRQKPADGAATGTGVSYRWTGWSDYDALVLTAGSIARAAIQIWDAPPDQVAVVAFGEPTASACAALGVPVAAVATTQDGPGVVAALAHALSRVFANPKAEGDPAARQSVPSAQGPIAGSEPEPEPERRSHPQEDR